MDKKLRFSVLILAALLPLTGCRSGEQEVPVAVKTVQFRAAARGAYWNGGVGVHGINWNRVETAFQSGQMLRLSVEAEFERVEFQFHRLVGNGRSVRQTAAVPICRKRKTHGRSIS